MVCRQLIWFHHYNNEISFGSDLMMSDKLSANWCCPKICTAWHQWTMAQQEPEPHFNITYQMHHMEDYPMVWRQLIWFHHYNNGISFGADLMISDFQPTDAAQKFARPYTNGPWPNRSQNHPLTSLIRCIIWRIIQWSGGNWYGSITNDGTSFGSDFLMSTKRSVNWCYEPNLLHRLTPICHQEPAQIFNITYQTHMEDYPMLWRQMICFQVGVGHVKQHQQQNVLWLWHDVFIFIIMCRAVPWIKSGVELK
jgi:hypothetical protein